MPWVLAAAAVTVGGTLLASNNASNAAQSAADAQTAATQASIAENARQFDQTRADTAPYRAIGASSLSALGGAFGLPGYGTTPAPSMTGTPAAVQPGAGLQDQTVGTNGVTYATKTLGTNTPSMTGATTATTTPGGPDYAAYLAANPDITANGWLTQHPPSSVGDLNHDGVVDNADSAALHFQTHGQGEGRTLPTSAAITTTNPPSMTGNGGYVAPPGYADPTAPNGYNAGARPTPAMTPAGYTPGALNIGLDSYQKSPDYNWRLGQGNLALDHIASSMGGIMSGARLKAADRYNQDFATTDYNNWRDYTTQQYNTNNSFQNQLSQEAIAQSNADRARTDGLYQDDRTFLTGQYNNRSGQLMTLAGFGANANAQNANAAQSFASSDAALRGTAATAQGNAAIGGANAFTSGVNNLMTTGAYLGGQYLSNPQSYYGVNAASSITPYNYSNMATSGINYNLFSGG